MLNCRYELLYHATGKRYQQSAIDGCTSFAILSESTNNKHLLMGQNWDWIPDVECVLVKNTDPDGLKRLSFVEAGILAGKPGINSEGLGMAVNGMYSTSDDWSRFHKPFHVRCYEILRSKNPLINPLKKKSPKNLKKQLNHQKKRKKLEKSNHKLYNFNSLIRYER